MSKIEEFEQLHKQTGWGLIPLIGKRPIEKDWQRWCESKRPFNKNEFRNGKNAGIPCGPANGILVIDVDDIEKFNSWLDEKKFELPVTRVHMTGSGKPHYIYEYPIDGNVYGNRSFKDPGGEIDPVTKKVKSVFDIRGLGGQIVAPGSIHPATQKEYAVRHDVDIAPAPGWLLKLAIQDATAEPIEGSEGAKNGLEGLNLPYPIKRLIEQGESNGKRSEAIMSVLNALVKANASDTTIIGIFEAYPIGQKYLEKGNSKEKWLLDQIKKVRGQEIQHKKAVGMSFNELEQEFGGETTWFWRKHLPAGLPCMLNGREGVGKTSICLQIAKEALETYPEGLIIWLACEGFVADTITKMKEIGLTSERFLVARKSDKGFRFNLMSTADIAEIREFFQTLDQPLLAVFVDSLRGATALDDNESRMRIPMQALNSIVCDEHRAALVYIHHFKKGNAGDLLDKSAGTTAITAAVRVVLSVERKSGFVRTLKQAKSNVSGNAPELTIVKMGDKIVISDAEQSDASQANRAEEFLVNLFKDTQDWLAKDIYAEGEKVGISVFALKIAKKTLGINASKKGPQEPWVWQWNL